MLRTRSWVVAAGLVGWVNAASGEALQWSGGATGVLQAASDDRLDPSATASVDVVADYALGGGLLTVFVEGATKVNPEGVAGLVPESNGDAGTAATDSGKGRVQVSELKFAMPIAARTTATAGLIDPASYVDQSRIASDENTQFLGANFVQNPTVALPDYTLGLVLERPGEEGSAGYTVLVSGSHGLADTSGRAYRELGQVGDDDRGAFAAVAAGWVHGGGRTRIGAWVNSAEFERLDGSGETNNYGVYALHGFTTNAGAFSVRLGVANPDVALVTGYLSLSWQDETPVGVLGLGAGGILASAQAPETASDGLTAEAYKRMALAKGLYLTPSLQYIRAAALDGSGAVVDRNLAVANLRLSWIW